jgi:hypothetical protein
MGNSSKDTQRLLDKLIKEEERQLYSEGWQKGLEFSKVLEDALQQLKGKDVTIEALCSCINPVEKEIYALIGEMRQIFIRMFLLQERGFPDYQYFAKVDTPDSGLCYDVVYFAIPAFSSAGIMVKEEDMWPTFSHSYLIIPSRDGQIAVDFASGQFIPENAGHVAISMAADYKRQLSNIIAGYDLPEEETEARKRKKEELEKAFEQARAHAIASLLSAAEKSRCDI